MILPVMTTASRPWNAGIAGLMALMSGALPRSCMNSTPDSPGLPSGRMAALSVRPIRHLTGSWGGMAPIRIAPAATWSPNLPMRCRNTASRCWFTPPRWRRCWTWRSPAGCSQFRPGPPGRPAAASANAGRLQPRTGACGTSSECGRISMWNGANAGDAAFMAGGLTAAIMPRKCTTSPMPRTAPRLPIA